MTKKITLLLFVLILSQNNFAQTENDVTKNNSQLLSELKGVVLDSQNKQPLPYTNIIVKSQNRGVISNEKGDYILSLSDLKKTDSIWFQYVGFITKKLTVNNLLLNANVQLEQDVVAMNEVLILNLVDDPETIVKNVIKYKEQNYNKTSPEKNQTFVRAQYNTDIQEFNIEFKKSSIEEIDEEMIETFEKNIPKHATSYSDVLAYVYTETSSNNKLQIKIDPIKIVALKEKDIAELDKIEKLFDSLFKNTGDKEYWKIKSGLIGGKIDIPEDSESDSLDNTFNGNYLNYRIKNNLEFSLFENKKQWEFLYKTGNYSYTIEGLTNVNGEDVYIISFTPNKNGLYEGSLYISTLTSALIKADYKYAPNKIGKDLQLLGIGFSETAFGGSIYFEKVNNTYELKYFSTKYGTEFSLNRNFSLQKKENKFLFDKSLNEIKARFKMTASNETIVEYLIVDSQKISKTTFDNFEEKKNMEVIYVEQFDENLWKDYPIIEPTEQMKTYKKLK